MVEKSPGYLKWFLILSLAVMLAACGSVEEKKLKFFNRGKDLYEKGEYVKARLEFRNALQVDPKFARGYYMLGQVEMKTSHPQQAFAAFSRAVELDPGLTEAQMELAGLFLMAREYALAEEKADLILSGDPENRDALLVKASALLATGKKGEGKDILKSMISRYPALPEPYLVLSQFFVREGDLAAAKKTLANLLERAEAHAGARLMLADIYEKMNDVAGAEKQYRMVLDQKPGDERLMALLARFYARNGRDGDAENILKELVTAHPEDRSHGMELARFYKDTGKRDAMVRLLEGLAEEDPGNLGAVELLALYSLEEKDSAGAVRRLDRFMGGVKTGPDFLQAKFLKALISFRDGKLDDSLVLLEEILRENPKHVRAHALKGDIKAVKGDYVAAISEYRFVLDEEPENIPVSMNLAKAHLSNSEPLLAEQTFKRVIEMSPALVEARFALADIYERKGNLDLVRKEMEEVLKVDPDNQRALSTLGILALRQRDLEGARSYIDRLESVRPDDANTYYQKGLVKLSENRPGEASKLFEDALKKDPDFEPALSSLLAVLVREKGMERAVARCLAQIEARPGNHRFHILLAQLYATDRDYDRAIGALEKALEINPDSQDALFGLAQMAQARGSIDEAILKYGELTKKNPDNAIFATTIGILYDMKGDFRKAAETYESVLAKNPDSAVAGNNLAFHYVERDPSAENLDKAERIMRPLLARFKDNPQMVDTWAWLCYRRGEFEKGRDALLGLGEKALQAPETSYHLGMIFHALGEVEQAKKYLKSAVEAAEDFPGKEEAERTLSRLTAS